jgi:hypothetical protein
LEALREIRQLASDMDSLCLLLSVPRALGMRNIEVPGMRGKTMIERTAFGQ